MTEAATKPVTRPGWHQGQMAGFDLETTGPDPETARVVTATIMQRGAEEVTQRWLINPGVDIPAEATAVHGITTEDAKDGLLPWIGLAEIASELHRILKACIPLVIYNAPYDLTVMDRETRRHEIQPFSEILTGAGGLIVDPMVLDKHLDPYRRGRRTLTAACAHYGVTLEDAHDSDADTLAAMRVAWKIAARNPRIAELEPAALHRLQVSARAEQAAGFEDYLRRQGKPERINGSWPFHPIPAATP
jgi:DNA polymerase-3 subunit epsilon